MTQKNLLQYNFEKGVRYLFSLRVITFTKIDTYCQNKKKIKNVILKKGDFQKLRIIILFSGLVGHLKYIIYSINTYK